MTVFFAASAMVTSTIPSMALSTIPATTQVPSECTIIMALNKIPCYGNTTRSYKFCSVLQ